MATKRKSNLKRKMDLIDEDEDEESQSETAMKKFPKMSFTCKDCSITMRVVSKEDMRRHYIEAHEKIPVDCNFCQKLFPSQKQVKEHKRGKHYFPCSFCTKICTMENDLEQHTKSEHGEKNTFMCELCTEFAFDKESNLQKHIKEVHEANANLRKCLICLYTGSGDEDLAKHSKIHVPQKCNECGENFLTLARYLKHKKQTGHDRKFRIHKKVKKNDGGGQVQGSINTGKDIKDRGSIKNGKARGDQGSIKLGKDKGEEDSIKKRKDKGDQGSIKKKNDIRDLVSIKKLKDQATIKKGEDKGETDSIKKGKNKGDQGKGSIKKRKDKGDRGLIKKGKDKGDQGSIKMVKYKGDQSSIFKFTKKLRPDQGSNKKLMNKK